MPQGQQADHEPTRAAGAPETLTFASGRYLATRLLGEGGQKRVYLGRDTQLHRDVAIAFIKAEGLDEAALDRVRREAQTIASLGSQPNVITIFDVGEEEGRPYTVCEYAPGGALRQELSKADGPLPLARALTIAQDLCQGLALAHAHGILHRDVKPENIWFTSTGTAKLGDFGLAVAFGQSRMTAPGTVLGTAAYMPPEQALGAEVDARGDLYSLGCVLYEMVTGQPPFPGGDTIAVVSQHINSAPSAPSWLNKDVPPSLDALIVRLLAKTPGERPASALAVLEELSAIASASAAGTERETAVVTLLFCDVVDSTELLTTLGDDAADEVRRVLLAALEREAREHRGTVVKSAGDGLMVSFRTSAADAVACAIAMQRAAGRVERGDARIGLELRVGISSGEASHEGGDWFGTPVVEAARLEAAARPGQILVSEVVRSIVGTRGGAQFRSAGRRELKGFARPVSVVEVVWRDDSTPPPVKRKARRPRRRRVWVAGGALVVIAGAAIAVSVLFVVRPSGRARRTGTDLPLVAEGYVPQLEPRDCPTGSDSALRCQVLIVPEDRSNPSRRLLQIPVTIAPSTAQKPEIPNVILGGIAGLSTSDRRKDGDAVNFGGRGYGGWGFAGSADQPAPLLSCPEMAKARRETDAMAWGTPDGVGLRLDAAEQCGRRLMDEGINLDSYGAEDVVDDIRDLVIAMGWHQIDLEASSDASTRDASLFAVRYQHVVHALVLHDPLPLDGPVQNDIIAYNSAVEAYFAACRADNTCQAAFPNLEQLVAEKYAHYQQERPVLTTKDPSGGPDMRVMVDGYRAVLAMLTALGGQALLPLIASTIASDDDAAATAVATGFGEFGALDPSDRLVSGAWINRYCEDEGYLMLKAVAQAEIATYPLFSGFADDWFFEVCARWPAKQRSGVIGSVSPRSSSVPTLILGGELNPYSPPDYAKRAAKPFKDATIAVFPNLTSFVLGNGPSCIADLRVAFLRDPKAKLDIDGCIEKVPPIKFVGTDRSSPIPAAPTSSAP